MFYNPEKEKKREKVSVHVSSHFFPSYIKNIPYVHTYWQENANLEEEEEKILQRKCLFLLTWHQSSSGLGCQQFSTPFSPYFSSSHQVSQIKKNLCNKLHNKGFPIENQRIAPVTFTVHSQEYHYKGMMLTTGEHFLSHSACQHVAMLTCIDAPATGISCMEETGLHTYHCQAENIEHFKYFLLTITHITFYDLCKSGDFNALSAIVGTLTCTHNLPHGVTWNI